MKFNLQFLLGALLIPSIISLAACSNGEEDTNIDANTNSDEATYTIGGTISGLANGASLVLSFNNRENLLIDSNGEFSFNQSLANLSYYSVAVSTQPYSPFQTCSLSGENGTVSNANIRSINVECITNSYALTAFVSGDGLRGDSSITLQNNGANDITLSNNGSYPFADTLSGSDYNISISSQSAFPSQTCSIESASGTMEGNDIYIYINCIRDRFTISGTLSNLATGANVTLQNNNTDNLILSANGSFSFSNTIEDGLNYAVSVFTQPTSTPQECFITNATGSLNSSNINNILVQCVTDTFANGFTLSSQSLGDQTSSESNTTKTVALGDIDADGDLDMISAGRVGQDAEIYLNDASGNFTSAQILNLTTSVTRTISSIALGDVDGDNDLDIVMGVSGAQGSMIYTNNGNGIFTDSGQALGASFDTNSIALGDIDGDGDLDMVQANAINGGSTNSTIPNRVFINNNGSFTDSGQSLGLANSSSIALGDLNGDGDLDMVVGNLVSANLVYFNNGTGTFTDSGVNSLGTNTSGGTTSSVALGDLDGDGDLDLITGRRGGTSQIYFNQNNSGIFTESSQDLGYADTTSIIIADIDGDADLDVILGNQDSFSSVYINDGNGVFSEHSSSSSLGTFSLQAMAIGDVDGDNDLDLITGNSLDDDRVIFNQAN